jgi:hypothetical protein
VIRIQLNDAGAKSLEQAFRHATDRKHFDRLQIVRPAHRGRKRQDIASKGFDPADRIAAYLHAIHWNCVTATNPRLFQSPFRAGIRIDAYQLEPLREALLLPRVNPFIADDVGPAWAGPRDGGPLRAEQRIREGPDNLPGKAGAGSGGLTDPVGQMAPEGGTIGPCERVPGGHDRGRSGRYPA